MYANSQRSTLHARMRVRSITREMQDIIVGRARAHDVISMHLSASDRDGMLTFEL